MVNTLAEGRWLLTWARKNKYKLTQRPGFTRQLVNRVPHPIFCSVCVSCFIKFGRLRVCPWAAEGVVSPWAPADPTESQFVLPLRSSSIYSCPPSAGWRLGAQYHLPAHTQKPPSAPLSLVRSSRPQDERDSHPTCRI